jgi:hypothetical protein
VCGGADCNDNGIPDALEDGADCNSNGVLDECDISAGTSEDCDENSRPDECDIILSAELRLLALARFGATNNPQLYTIDPATGEPSDVLELLLFGEVPFVNGGTSLAVDPLTGLLYAVLDNGDGPGYLTIINPLGGLVAFIFPQLRESIADIAFGPDGTLYAVAGNSSGNPEPVLLTINKFTGLISQTEVQLPAGRGQSLAADLGENLLYHAATPFPSGQIPNPSALLTTIDLTDLAATTQTLNTTQRFNAITHGPDGELYAYAGSALYVINPASGAVSLVGAAEIAGIAGMAFLPFSADCNVNLLLDTCEIAANPELDLNTNGYLDECDGSAPLP